MKSVILALGAALVCALTACGIFDEGNRRYSCSTHDDCIDGYECTGSITQPLLADGGCATAGGDGGGSVTAIRHDEYACHFMYCLPEGKAECDGKACRAGYQCGARNGDNNRVHCVDEDAVRRAAANHATCPSFSNSDCGADTGSTDECVLSLQLAVENNPAFQADWSLVKMCVPPAAFQ